MYIKPSVTIDIRFRDSLKQLAKAFEKFGESAKNTGDAFSKSFSQAQRDKIIEAFGEEILRESSEEPSNPFQEWLE